MTVMDKGELVRVLRKVAAVMRLEAPKAETMSEMTAQCEIANAFDALADELEASTEEKADGLD